METLNLTIGLLAFMGMIIHILIFVSSKTNKKNPFSLKVYFADSNNIIRLILSVLSTFSLLLMLDDIISFLEFHVENYGRFVNLTAFTIGYLNDSLIKNIIKIVGRNK